MGYKPCTEIRVWRDYSKREIVVEYVLDSVKYEKRFPMSCDNGAMEFALKEFTQLAM